MRCRPWLAALAFAAGVCGRSSGAALPPQPPSLPTLAWEVRSDWQVVTAFGAKGDGKTDDTAAVQAALAFVQRGGQGNAPNKTLFFPAGTYLITTTLLLNETSGVMLLGTGATTTLLWGGGKAPAPPPDGGLNRLLWSDGNTRFHLEGFVFDGAGVGEVGLDHDSHTTYESRVVHRHLAFLRWQTAGVRVGHNQAAAKGVASAEMLYLNCVFWYNYAGVMLLAWNDYDNAFSGCHFQDNMGYGIEVQAGNIYVADSRFERNLGADATLVNHESSFRRIVSIGSGCFLKGRGCSPTKIQNVYVAGWGNATNASQPVTAIQAGGPGPLQIYDAVFEAPLSQLSPILHVSSYPFGGADAPVLRANVTILGCPTCPFIQPFDPYPVNNVPVFDLPPGDAAIRASIPALSRDTHFFSSTATMPGRVFDAVRDFGASTGAESSGAIQACINAAASAGARAMCYLPAGVYSVNRTLALCGAQPFSLTGGGSGFTTLLRWGPQRPAPGTVAVVLAAGPGAGCAEGSNVAIERLNAFTNLPGVLDLVVSRSASVPASPTGRHGAFTLPAPFLLPHGSATSTGSSAVNSTIVFDSFYFQSAGGAVLSGLVEGDVVHGSLWDGNLEVLDSATAIVHGTFYAIGPDGLVVARMQASSPTPPAPSGPGFLGFVTLVAASNVYDVHAFNSSSLAVGDFYSACSCVVAHAQRSAPPPPPFFSHNTAATPPQLRPPTRASMLPVTSHPRQASLRCTTPSLTSTGRPGALLLWRATRAW
jgi:hypothetical protein